MKNLMLMAAALLIAPCALAQDATPPPPPAHAPMGPARAGTPRAARHDDQNGPYGRRFADDGRHDARGFDRMRGPDGPMMSMWWKNPEMAQRLALTPEQTKRIDDLFLQSKVELIHLHATLEEQELLLEPLMDANPVDQGKAMAQIDKIADTRASLEKTNAKMLLSIRAVLSADQWTKLHDHHDRPRAEGRRDDMHGGMRGPHAPGGGPDAKAPGAPPAE